MRGEVSNGFLLAGLALALGLGGSDVSAQEAERWTFGATTRASHTTNLLFIPGGPGETLGGLVLSLGYARVRQHSRLSVSGWAIGNKFHEFTSFDGVRGGLDMSGSFPLSPVVQLRFSENVSSGFNPERLYGTGELLPQVRVLSNVTSAGIDYSMTRSTRLDVGGDFTWFRYESDIPVVSPQLAADTFPEQAVGPEIGPTQSPLFGLTPDPLLSSVNLAAVEGFLALNYNLFTYHAGVGLSHEFSEIDQGQFHVGYRNSRYEDVLHAPSVTGGLIDVGFSFRRALDSTAGLSAGYVYQTTTYRPSVNTHSLTGRFDKEVTGKWKADASLGVSWYDGDAVGDSGWSLVGGVGASRRWKRGSASLRYEHTLYQALGFGRVLGTDFFYAEGSYVPWKRTALGGYAGLRNTGDLVSSPYTFDEGFAGVYASYHPWKRTGLNVDYSYRRYSFGALSPAGANVLGFSISYARNWK